MYSLSNVLRSEYFRLLVLMAACYIAVRVTDHYIGVVDYVIIVWVLVMDRINEDNALGHALTFGIYYDLLIHNIVGISVFVFLGLTVLKMRAGLLLDMEKRGSRVLLLLMIVSLFVVYNLLYFEYSGVHFLRTAARHILVDMAIIGILFWLKGMKRAVSYAQG